MVVRLAQHILKPEVRDQKVGQGAAQIIPSALAASRVAMQVFDRATEFLADVRGTATRTQLVASDLGSTIG
jgi:hypothetical protein